MSDECRLCLRPALKGGKISNCKTLDKTPENLETHSARWQQGRAASESTRGRRAAGCRRRFAAQRTRGSPQAGTGNHLKPPHSCHPALRKLNSTAQASRYGTFCDLAGVEMTDVRAQAAGLPPVDSISLVPVLLGTGPSQRRMIPISTEPRPLPLYGHTNQISTLQGIIAEGSDGKLWKLLLGTVEMAQWTGPHYPCVQFRRALPAVPDPFVRPATRRRTPAALRMAGRTLPSARRARAKTRGRSSPAGSAP